MHTRSHRIGTYGAVLAVLLSGAADGWGQASPFRGLWVGAVELHAVNEVTVPLDAANVPIAPDPARPTPTYDRADLRIILHVNGAGQVNLLKDVAILNRSAEGGLFAETGLAERESDLALVTDPRLYAEFPPQPAYRIASAVFDFGDAPATDVLDALVEAAAQAAAAFVDDDTLSLETSEERIEARNQAAALMAPDLAEIIEHADVAEAFGQFLLSFNAGALNAIAADPADPIVDGFLADAEALRDRSVYGDTRALEMVQAVVAAVEAAPEEQRQTAAHRTASSFADVSNLYQRFVSGKTFGDMIRAAADAGAVAAKEPGATAATIEAVMRGTPEAVKAMTEALQAKVHLYNDTRSSDAIDAVLAAMAAEAHVQAAQSPAFIKAAAESAGWTALTDVVARYPLPVMAPTIDYNEFVKSAAFQGAAAVAASAAAEAAIDERVADPLYTVQSLYNAAKVGAVNALRNVYGAAARTMRTELPLAGTLAPGSGDARMNHELAHPSDLGPAGLEGRIYLPAHHPTNPFRHRRHPDHTAGINIERLIRFDFDGVAGSPLEAAGYGVDRISGTYREEIFGLHKPLGPDPGAPIGLRTEGRFELRRISLIDTLNTR